MIKRRVVPVVSITIVVVLVLVTLAYLHSPKFQPVKTVVINGVDHPLEKRALVKSIKPLFHNKNFFAVDISAVKARLQNFTWIANANVRRQWPDTIVINLGMIKPQALWGRTGVVTRYGEVIYPLSANLPQNLPDFSGPNEQAALRVLSTYRQLMTKLRPLSLKIDKIGVDDSDSWQITLNNGMNLALGKKDILTRADYFVKVYPQVFASTKRKAKSVDLRYKNGMAVAWEK
ncbi:MAG: cell division protein FtsQ/DivIB [Pseudomonadota bacterium]